MGVIAAETIKDPIFQLAAVVFALALAISVWMFISALKNRRSDRPSSSLEQEPSAVAATNLSQEAKFQLLLENIIAISKRLDELDAKLKSVGAPADPVARQDIAVKLDAMYKILSGLSGSEQK